MDKGDIVLASLRVSNGGYKLRPALIINSFPPYGDYLVCGISSRLEQNIEQVAHLLSSEETYFKYTGLRKSSVVRLNYLAVIPEQTIAGKIGNIPPSVYQNILNKFIVLIKS